MEKQVFITIPQSARYQLGIDSGSSIQYIENEGKNYWQSFRIESVHKPIRKPIFSSIKRVPEYRVTSQGQVTVPKYILESLQIKNKEELGIEFDADSDKLILVKNYIHQFQDILLSLRPNFYEDRENELLTIVVQDEPGEGNDRLLFVERNMFNHLLSLYYRIKKKYEPNTESPWVGVPDVGDQGVSITLDESVISSWLTVTKLGDKYLSDPIVARLWRERIAFFMDRKNIYYYDNGRQMHEITPYLADDIMQIFNRNAKQFGSYRDASDQLVETVLFYTGDMAIFRSPNNTVEFLPKRS